MTFLATFFAAFLGLPNRLALATPVARRSDFLAVLEADLPAFRAASASSAFWIRMSLCPTSLEAS